ncbi:MAG: thermonuclease family protein [Pseudorhizobium sp.]
MAGPRRKTARKASGRKKRASGSGRGSTWFWGAALVVLVGTIAAYDNSAAVRRFAGNVLEQRQETVAARPAPAKAPQQKVVASRPVPVPPKAVPETRQRPVTRPRDGMQTAAITPPAPIGNPNAARPAGVVPAAVRPDAPVLPNGPHQTKFYLCGTAKQDDCVIAGDSFMLHGQKIRLAGIEVPDMDKPGCEAERIKGSDAELRVRAFLDSGPFELVAAGAGDADSRGQKIRAVMRNGISLSDILVREGLARRPGAKGGWC